MKTETHGLCNEFGVAQKVVLELMGHLLVEVQGFSQKLNKAYLRMSKNITTQIYIPNYHFWFQNPNFVHQ